MMWWSMLLELIVITMKWLPMRENTVSAELVVVPKLLDLYSLHRWPSSGWNHGQRLRFPQLTGAMCTV